MFIAKEIHSITLEMKLLLVVRSEVTCLSCKSKSSFCHLYSWIKSFKFLGAVIKSESNLDTFKAICRVCLKVVLFLIVGYLRDSVKLVNWSRQVVKATLTVNYMTNIKFCLWHATKDSKRKWFSASIPQLHNTLLFTSTYGWLGILTGMSLLILHMMC